MNFGKTVGNQYSNKSLFILEWFQCKTKYLRLPLGLDNSELKERICLRDEGSSGLG